MSVDRRTFLKSAGLLGTTVGMTLPRIARAEAPTFGETVEDPDGIMDLAEGFTYTIIQTAITEDTADGWRVPGRPDGMACWEVDGKWVLMRNHELSPSDVFSGFWAGKADSAPPESFDQYDQGCVSRVVIDPETLEVLSTNLVLAGTRRNCAGGISPWGWLSCEESTDPGHGWVFACPLDAEALQEPQQIKAYGRFNHEAIAIDPETNTAYMTEDKGDGCIYRFVPDSKDDPWGAGKLQAMAVQGVDKFDTSEEMETGDVVGVRWIDVVDNTSDIDDLRYRATDKGAARIARGEGMWWHEGKVYFTSTSGGPTEGGQIFCLDLADMSLELLAQSTDRQVLDYPDNMCVSPWGQVWICEDGSALDSIRYLTADGEIREFARNRLSTSEFTGICFSPDGTTMFVNIQSNGLTFAIRGDFPGEPSWLNDAEPGDTDAPDDDDKKGCDQTGGVGVRAGTVLATTMALLGLRSMGRTPAAKDGDDLSD